MYRVGILGTENSHAMAFAKTMNTKNEKGEYNYPDFRVTALYALEKSPSEEIVKACPETEIKIVSSPEEMLPLVDCVMVTSRHGKYHLPFAKPFIKAGMPCFIDKPVTISVEDTRELLALAAENKVPLIGGSGCKFSPELLEMKTEIAEGKVGKLYSGIINFPAELESEYGGMYFYGSHLVEMAMTAFGSDILSVSAFASSEGHLTAVARYTKYDIILNFVRNYQYIAIAYGAGGNIVKNPNIGGIYESEVKHFVDMIRTGKSAISTDDLVKPVYVLNAIEKSLAEKREVALSEF
ncbi:MAG: Gfo/Idh/MocA family oxidoreductase [Oscillospiraceae bacterium]|nr:Gfo/Idh/MocA family oxidoreductase [Oscillospiraceae bacterium]